MVLGYVGILNMRGNHRIRFFNYKTVCIFFKTYTRFRGLYLAGFSSPFLENKYFLIYYSFLGGSLRFVTG
jgi:hypothetical protein